MHEVTSPLPGTFYHRESPTSDPFVQVGATVAAGDTVGLVEVMKMFNPVTTEVAGTVVEIRFQNEDPVDVDDVLVVIEES
ncbi:acetyl-CoA carboxylase [Nakamurella sp.]|uniref:acetyl-CoA carboxylase n=1 Tax=Nakamurella sp. TaxID=1869182 RepID=UPI003783853F